MNARPRTDREALDAAFDRLVHTHRASLERFTQQLGASREDAEEIAATALLRAYQSQPGRPGVDWRPWLRTVARNLWIDMRRRRVVHLIPDERALERVPSTAQTVDQIAATAEEAREICAAIALLPAPQRAAIYLREVRGLSYDEIALELGMTLAAVTSTLHRARQRVSLGHKALRTAMGLVVAPCFLLRHAAGAARIAATSGVVVKGALPIAFAATLGGATVVVKELRTPVPQARLASTMSGQAANESHVSQPTASRRATSRLTGKEHPSRVPPAGSALSALPSARADSSLLSPSGATPRATNVSDAATRTTAGTAPPASPPATGSESPSAPPTVAGDPAPAQKPPADTQEQNAPAASRGRSASAPGRSTSAKARSSGSATGQQHRATGNGNGSVAATTHESSAAAAHARSDARAAASTAALPKRAGSQAAPKAAANGANTPARSPSADPSASAHGHAVAPESAPADTGPTTADVPASAPANASPADAGHAADSQGQGAAGASAGGAGAPAKPDPPANDAHPTGQGHTTGPPATANAAAS